LPEDPDDPADSLDGRYQVGPPMAGGLRPDAGLRPDTGPGLAEMAGMTLDAVVPGFADAGVVFVAEHLLRGGDPASGERVPGQVTLRRIANRFTGGGRDAAPFPPGAAVVFAADSPYARCLDDGKPVAFARPDRQTLDHVGPQGRNVFAQYASFLVVPMGNGTATAGLIALARASGKAAFGDSDIGDIVRLASFGGTSIANAVTLARYQVIAGALQRGLLAAEPPRPEHLHVAARCLPANGHLVGGDWYDLISLPGGRTGIVTGDVMGHGPEAAAVMAQLRAAAHVLAQLDLEPAELLGRLDRLIATLHDMPLATCMYAVIDPADNSCTVAAAGHLPPVLALPGGGTRTLDMLAGQSLGIGPATYGQARIKLPPGTVIAFYTDGLVETRTRSFDQGITALQEQLADPSAPLEATCDRLIGALACHPEDDVTLILVRIPPGEH
jgi:hypothetical protein